MNRQERAGWSYGLEAPYLGNSINGVSIRCRKRRSLRRGVGELLFSLALYVLPNPDSGYIIKLTVGQGQNEEPLA